MEDEGTIRFRCIKCGEITTTALVPSNLDFDPTKMGCSHCGCVECLSYDGDEMQPKRDPLLDRDWTGNGVPRTGDCF